VTKVLVGNMFESRAQTLVNTVNCVGVMGKGIALEFKTRFPDMFKDYEAHCRRGEVRLGEPYLYRYLTQPWILNFPTKDHWRSVAKLDDIVRGLDYLSKHYREWGIQSLAVPPLGCGEGRLEWRIVGRTLYRYLSRMDLEVEMYAPYGTPDEQLRLDFLGGDMPSLPSGQARIKVAWVALASILKRIEDEPYHWPIGRTTFQKIAYVATAEGIPTGLHYSRGSFGHFSPDMTRVVTTLVNNGLVKEERRGQMFTVTLGPGYEDAAIGFHRELEPWDDCIARIADLFMRANSSNAEMIATVLFATGELLALRNDVTEGDVLESVMQWKQRRTPPFDRARVASVIRDLAALGWLKVHASPELVPLAADALEF
jgi:O-acetyl-ADP-ribose deacetylase (regulator of RNase III)/uncharacterized protein YwgA